NVKPIQQLLDPGVAVEVDVGVRMAVARQELFDAKRARRMSRPQKHDVSEAMSNQFQPAQDEGSHENLAQFAVGLNESQQLFAFEFDQFARLADSYSNQSGAAR